MQKSPPNAPAGSLLRARRYGRGNSSSCAGRRYLRSARAATRRRVATVGNRILLLDVVAMARLCRGWTAAARGSCRDAVGILMLEHWHHGRHATQRAARLLAEWAES